VQTWAQLSSSIRRFGRWWSDLPPPDARVDPALFPETEYPVYCMRCGYDLRGLTHAQCPECGEPFERGRLLFDQYVRCKRPRSDRRCRLSRALVGIGMALEGLIVLAFASITLAAMRRPDGLEQLLLSPGRPEIRFVHFVLGTLALAFACFSVAGVLRWTTLPPRAKRRAVQDTFRADQRKSTRRSARVGEHHGTP
jgi:hypothetical protein